MDEDQNIGAALDSPEYAYTNAPAIDDSSSFAMTPTGTQMDLSFLDEPYNEGWDESKKALWEQKWISGISPTPADAAKTAQSILSEQRKAANDRAAQRGKPMTSTEVEKITQLDGVGYSLDLLEQKLNEIPDKDRGPIAGRLDSANPYNVQAQEIQNIITSVTPGLARGVFGEVGVLTDTDIERYKRLLPSPSTLAPLAKKNLANLREKLADSKIKQIETMRKAGMDVAGFEDDYNQLVQEREARKQQAQQAQAQKAQQQQAQMLPVMRGPKGERLILVTPETRDKNGNAIFDPTENNGQPYYEEE